MRRLSTSLAALLLAGAGLAATVPAGQAAAAEAAPRAASAAACGTGWGSVPKVSTDSRYTPLRDIRTGSHGCFDRMVFDTLGPDAGARIGYHVRYVDRLRQDGSGDVIPVRGGAILEVRVAAPSYDPRTGQATYDGKVRQSLPDVRLSGYPTFRDTRFGGSFEGDTQVGLGVRARLPFRVFQTGNHVVVDVAHSWNGFR
ncbi:AMIN-like domain-containing (lipo)protein [Streptomyces griseocarneus]|uniref:AMIN-like domain-containing (lipo)protein n=1 Tax=Streptomyces griseocarneus TaxID=51201 RepID=UPI00167CCEAE|nr:hypothetical protein [Streptomyces griseocarneus]MBZ6473626.1 hypothetical protein [Streptomyces griseocarneus]GHG55944.1 hypothetical protein GCM10018779_19590 [Streptomyces griseocarneus]